MSSEKSRVERYKESANRAKDLELVADTAAHDRKLTDDEKQSVADYIESIRPKSRKRK